MKKTNKKGFTIVELVIVIAVIAILAAVLIPTFSGIVKKANLSADQQAVRQMNTILATEDLSDDGIVRVIELLSENGYNTEKKLSPLLKDHSFYWYKTTNQIVYVNEANGAFTLVYPEIKDFPTTKTNDIQSLELVIGAILNAPSVSTNSTEVGSTLAIKNYTVPSGVETFEEVIAWINTLDDTNNGVTNKKIKCTVNGAEKTGILLDKDVKLTSDVVLDVWAEASTLAINIAGDVTIDLNGFKFTQNNHTGRGHAIALFLVRPGATLNIIDSSTNKTGRIESCSSAFQIDNGGTVNLYGGTITASSTVATWEDGGNEYTDAGDQRVFVYGGTFNMFGGKIDSQDYAIGGYNTATGGYVNLFGGEINGWIYTSFLTEVNNYGATINGGIN